MKYVNDGNTVLDYHEINARRWVIDLMKECFSFDKDDRPNFRRIYFKIEEESEFNLESDDESDESEYYCNSAYWKFKIYCENDLMWLIIVPTELQIKFLVIRMACLYIICT